LDEAGYRRCIAQAEELLATPEFQRLMRLIAGSLHVAPVLDAGSVEILANAAGVPFPLEGGEEWST
jgi:hypothetical protein